MRRVPKDRTPREQQKRLREEAKKVRRKRKDRGIHPEVNQEVVGMGGTIEQVISGKWLLGTQHSSFRITSTVRTHDEDVVGCKSATKVRSNITN